MEASFSVPEKIVANKEKEKFRMNSVLLKWNWM